MDQTAIPPETVEGWYVFHQIFQLDRVAMRGVTSLGLESMQDSAVNAVRDLGQPREGGWSVLVPLYGSRADLMMIHFRPALDDIGAVQRRMAREPLFDLFRPVASFLGVTEAGLYHLTTELAREAARRDGTVGDDEYRRQLAERLEAELASEHTQRRLYPPLPTDMPYVCFYPMSKKREAGQNWYSLPLDERNRLMRAHGMTGRRFAGRIVQVISGSMGLDDWEWGVTLFARDPLEFKRIVTEMRFDEASARFGNFGEFFVGRVVGGEMWIASLV